MIRFYSFLALVRFLQGLSNIGYAPSSYNVKELFLSKGYNRDLHLYSCDIVFMPDRVILTFNTPIPKHKGDSDFVSSYLPPLSIILEKNNDQKEDIA